MTTEQIVFLIIGLILLISCVPLFWWYWRAHKYPISENELAYSNWFTKWIKENKATFLLIFSVIVFLCALSFLGVVSFSDQDLMLDYLNK